jgi:hypothetical protein
VGAAGRQARRNCGYRQGGQRRRPFETEAFWHNAWQASGSMSRFDPLTRQHACARALSAMRAVPTSHACALSLDQSAYTSAVRKMCTPALDEYACRCHHHMCLMCLGNVSRRPSLLEPCQQESWTAWPPDQSGPAIACAVSA